MLRSTRWLDLLSNLAATAYNRAASEDKKLGLSLLIGTIAGAESDKGTLYRLQAPAFRPEIVPADMVVSLGSGSIGENHRQLIRDFESTLATTPPDYHGALLAVAVVRAITTTPVVGVSPHFHVAYIERGMIRFAAQNGTLLTAGHPERELHMPVVASTWREMSKLLGKSGRAGSAAT